MQEMNDLYRDIETAMEIMQFLKERNISPADSVMPMAALHALFLFFAREEGKTGATIDEYVSIYRSSLELYAPLMKNVAEQWRKENAS